VLFRQWCLISEAAIQGEKFLKPMSLTYHTQGYAVALLVHPGKVYRVIAVKLYGIALCFKLLLMHMDNGDQSMNTSQFLNGTWKIHCLVLQGILSEYCDDAVLQLYQLDEHECVSFRCSNSAVLGKHLPKNSRRFHLVVIANVNANLGQSTHFQQVIRWVQPKQWQMNLYQGSSALLLVVQYKEFVAYLVAVEKWQSFLSYGVFLILAAQSSLSNLNAQRLNVA
jgi:hypothetical protein